MPGTATRPTPAGTALSSSPSASCSPASAARDVRSLGASGYTRARAAPQAPRRNHLVGPRLAPPTRSGRERRVGAAPGGAYGRGVVRFRRRGGRSGGPGVFPMRRGGGADYRGEGHDGLSVGCADDGESKGNMDVVCSRAVLVHQ